MSTLQLPTAEQTLAKCAQDGEFLIAAVGWSGRLAFKVGEELLAIGVKDGLPTPCDNIEQLGERAGDVYYSGPAEVWSGVLASPPPRLLTDLISLAGNEGPFTLHSDIKFNAQYYPAICRYVELLRGAFTEDPAPSEQKAMGSHDAPVGRYVHLTLDGQDYRVYYEEAGQGIPLLLQHTAGAHGTQYRHIFECKEITDRFRVIAYDLPYHGKSIPPVGKDWWKEPYALTGDFVRSVPVTLSKVLGLDKPVFMGCSVGGMLALDLAYHHPDAFRAVLSLEGALKVPENDPDDEVSATAFSLLYHPQVSNHYKARLMNGLMSPKSPEHLRQEVMQVYSQGWPPAFLGDLNYYVLDYDLRGKAQDIDTSKCAVHIFSGEYDLSGTVELGKEAHEAIKGSTFTVMESMGHFPMQENPVQFFNYVLPVLETIR